MITPNRSSTPTNVVYPVVEPGYTPPPIETSSTPLLGGPGTVFTSAAVASRTIVSERSIPEASVEGEDESPSKVMLASILMLCTIPAVPCLPTCYITPSLTPLSHPFTCLPTCYITPCLTPLSHPFTCSLARCVLQLLAGARACIAVHSLIVNDCKAVQNYVRARARHNSLPFLSYLGTPDTLPHLYQRLHCFQKYGMGKE